MYPTRYIPYLFSFGLSVFRLRCLHRKPLTANCQLHWIRSCVAAAGFLRSRTALLYLVALPLTTRWFHTQSPVVSSILAYRMELILQKAMSATCLPFRGVNLYLGYRVSDLGYGVFPFPMP